MNHMSTGFVGNRDVGDCKDMDTSDSESDSDVHHQACRLRCARCVLITCAVIFVLLGLKASVMFVEICLDIHELHGVASYSRANCTVLPGAQISEVKCSFWGCSEDAIMLGYSNVDLISLTDIVVRGRHCGEYCMSYQTLAPVLIHAFGSQSSGVRAVAYQNAGGVVGYGTEDKDEAMKVASECKQAEQYQRSLACWYTDGTAPWKAVLSSDAPSSVLSRYGNGLATWSYLIFLPIAAVFSPAAGIFIFRSRDRTDVSINYF